MALTSSENPFSVRSTDRNRQAAADRKRVSTMNRARRAYMSGDSRRGRAFEDALRMEDALAAAGTPAGVTRRAGDISSVAQGRLDTQDSLIATQQQNLDEMRRIRAETLAGGRAPTMATSGNSMGFGSAPSGKKWVPGSAPGSSVLVDAAPAAPSASAPSSTPGGTPAPAPAAPAGPMGPPAPATFEGQSRKSFFQKAANIAGENNQFAEANKAVTREVSPSIGPAEAALRNFNQVNPNVMTKEQTDALAATRRTEREGILKQANEILANRSQGPVTPSTPQLPSGVAPSTAEKPEDRARYEAAMSFLGKKATPVPPSGVASGTPSGGPATNAAPPAPSPAASTASGGPPQPSWIDKKIAANPEGIFGKTAEAAGMLKRDITGAVQDVGAAAANIGASVLNKGLVDPAIKVREAIAERAAVAPTGAAAKLNKLLPNTEARADGGPVKAGKAYLVGEEGPEIVVPAKDGVVIPAKQSQTLLDEQKKKRAQMFKMKMLAGMAGARG